MINKDVHTIIMLGIGGIGMSAIARYFNDNGYAVFGYDRTPTKITTNLQKEGIQITFEDDVNWIDKIIAEQQPQHILGIYTPAIPSNLALKHHVEKRNIELIKRSQALGRITMESTNLSVAGTHGKTTTSCLLAHILDCANIPFVAFLGGISTNFESNYKNTIPVGQPGISITEADEFDRSFLQLTPTYAAITNMDADHLDIYEDEANLIDSFKQFGQKILPQGKLFVQQSLVNHFSSDAVTYGIELGHISARHVHIHEGRYIFDLYTGSEVFRNLVLGIPGEHNVENAVAASAIALKVGVTEDQLRMALAQFRGVKRRFEYIINSDVVYIDDYAHHPTELEAIISSVKKLYPRHRITGIFQPHLYSRTRDFVEGFADSLSLLDEVILMDIYPAREEPIPGVTSNIILDRINAPKRLLKRDDIIPYLAESKPEVLLTLGAGDIDTLVEPIKEMLLNA